MEGFSATLVPTEPSSGLHWRLSPIETTKFAQAIPQLCDFHMAVHSPATKQVKVDQVHIGREQRTVLEGRLKQNFSNSRKTSANKLFDEI